MKIGEIVEVEILDAADKAQTFARLPDGMPLFVQGPAAVGDFVRVEIVEEKAKFAIANLLEVLKFSDRRTEPVCSFFGVCGGCKWQHLDYSEQLRIKTKMVADNLSHIGGFRDFPVLPTIGATELYHYRNKVDFSVTDIRWLSNGEVRELENRGYNYRGMNSDEMKDVPCSELKIKELHFAMGFHLPGTFLKALDIDQCYLVSDDMNRVRDVVRAFCIEKDISVYSTTTNKGEIRNLVVRQGGNTGELMVNLVTSSHKKKLMEELRDRLVSEFGDKLTTFVNSTTRAKNTVAFGEEEFVMFGDGVISDRLGDFTYQISANSFFQTNTAQAEVIYDQIIEQAAMNGTETVYDFCCGTGSISLYASKHCKKVLGVELVEDSVRDAKANAERNGVTNCTFKQLDMKDFKRNQAMFEEFGMPDVVITDPPRAGMHPRSVDLLLELAPEKIVYVSCNPASLARDGKMFCENGAYEMVKVQPVDMFPQTNHIESVALFLKK